MKKTLFLAILGLITITSSAYAAINKADKAVTVAIESGNKNTQQGTTGGTQNQPTLSCADYNRTSRATCEGAQIPGGRSCRGGFSNIFGTDTSLGTCKWSSWFKTCECA